jgi:hypothetical protein
MRATGPVMCFKLFGDDKSAWRVCVINRMTADKDWRQAAARFFQIFFEVLIFNAVDRYPWLG